MCVDKSNRKPLVNPERQTMSLLRIAINIAEIFFYWGENKAGSSSCCYRHHQLGLKAEGAGPWKQGWVTSASLSCKLYSNSNFLFLSLNIYNIFLLNINKRTHPLAVNVILKFFFFFNKMPSFLLRKIFLSLKPTVMKLNKYEKIKRQTYVEFQLVMNYRVYTKRCREQAPQPHLLAN